MKKVTLVVQSKDVDPTLRALGEAGVLHIEHQNAPVSEDIRGLEEKLHFLSKAIEILLFRLRQGFGGQAPQGGERKGEEVGRAPKDLVYKVLSLVDEKEIIAENLKRIEKDILIWKEWGDFDPTLLDDLKNKGIWVRLCKITKKEVKFIPEGIILERLFKKGNILYCVAISREEKTLPFESLSLPEKSLKEMLLEERKEEERIKDIDKKLAEFSEYKNALVSYKKELSSLIEFNKTRQGMGTFQRLSYLRGYCPAYNISLVEKLAEKERWALVIEEPSENDNVPTLIKNPRWVEMIKPVLQMIKTIPGYREVDISLWFLLFFSVFFGMLIGDAGYGAIFFIINLFCHIKFKGKVKDKSIFLLTYVLSTCAIIWGALSGTFFGRSFLPERIEPLLPYLTKDANIQGLCFLIGAVHLSIAHMWKLIRRFPSLRAFSEAGWISILWSAYFLARTLILGEAFPEFGKLLFIVGAALVILFTNPSKNIFKAIGSGVGNFLLYIVNSFTDLVSYIRLFAVGAATVAVADAFNQMAFSIGYSSILSGFLTALVLLFGHTLNILLGAMAILVHGVRLNVLEFSSHLNMEWSGVEYAPFEGKGD